MPAPRAPPRWLAIRDQWAVQSLHRFMSLACPSRAQCPAHTMPLATDGDGNGNAYSSHPLRIAPSHRLSAPHTMHCVLSPITHCPIASPQCPPHNALRTLPPPPPPIEGWAVFHPTQWAGYSQPPPHTGHGMAWPTSSPTTQINCNGYSHPSPAPAPASAPNLHRSRQCAICTLSRHKEKLRGIRGMQQIAISTQIEK